MSPLGAKLGHITKSRRLVWCTVMVIALALAGCAEQSGQEQGGEHGQNDVPDLQTPPIWQVGDWWTYRFTATPFNDYSEEVTVVVADITDDHYLVGMPADAYRDFSFAFHFPPMGEVQKSNLQWIMHDTWLQTIDFPLTNASTWDVDIVGFQGSAEVEVTSPTTASITIAPFLAPMRAEYDAEIGHYTRIGIDDYGYADLLDHGTNYTGEVLVPMNQQTIFYGRAAGVVAIDDPLFRIPSSDPTQPDTGVNPSPLDSIDLPMRDRLSLVQWVGTFFLVPESTAGEYLETAEAPDGKVYEISRTPADGEGVSMQWFGIDDPGGMWSFTHVAAGGGIATSEGILHDRLSFIVGG